MTIKYRNIIKILSKVAILSFIIAIALNLWSFFIDGKEENVIVNNNDNTIFINSKIDPIANVWVAISTNIWIKYTERQTISYDNIYKNIYSAQDILENRSEVKSELIGKNMLFIREYFNFIKTDFNNLLKNSTDKKTTLNNIINQLEFRFRTSLTNLNILAKQEDIIILEYQKTLEEINITKQDMEKSYYDLNTIVLNKNMNNYYDLKRKEAILKTHLVFINWFQREYNSINAYNKTLLDTLINNKDIISKDSYLVIPDSWDVLLEQFNLVISEEQYKANIKKEEDK